MIKTIKKIGNSKGIILDAALLEMAHLKEGDRLSVTVHEGGAITFAPVEPHTISDEVFDETAKKVLADYSETLKKLS
jgi:antitoxin component of MazEF toxin-antitoxin module